MINFGSNDWNCGWSCFSVGQSKNFDYAKAFDCNWILNVWQVKYFRTKCVKGVSRSASRNKCSDLSVKTDERWDKVLFSGRLLNKLSLFLPNLTFYPFTAENESLAVLPPPHHPLFCLLFPAIPFFFFQVWVVKSKQFLKPMLLRAVSRTMNYTRGGGGVVKCKKKKK